MLTKAAFIWSKHSKNSKVLQFLIIVIYSFDAKLTFQQPLIQWHIILQK